MIGHWTVLIFCLDEKLLDFTPLWNKYLMTLKKKNNMLLLEIVVYTIKCTRHYSKHFILILLYFIMIL